MKKMCYLFLLLFAFNTSIYSQPSSLTDGKYINNDIRNQDDFIIIKKDSLYYIENSDTTAKCRYSFIDNYFIEIHQECIQRNFMVESKYDTTINQDSIRIIIDTPYSLDLIISFQVPIIYPNKFVLTKDKRSIDISNMFFKGYLRFKLYPTFYKKRYDNKFYGNLFMTINFHAEASNANSYVIHITALSDNYFKENLIDGEYMMIQDNTIIWRGIKWNLLN